MIEEMTSIDHYSLRVAPITWETIHEDDEPDGLRVEVAPSDEIYLLTEDDFIKVAGEFDDYTWISQCAELYSPATSDWLALTEEHPAIRGGFKFWYLRVSRGGKQGPVRFIAVPTKPIHISTRHHEDICLEGPEAGLCITAMAWTHSLRRLGEYEWRVLPQQADRNSTINQDYHLAAGCFVELDDTA